jgi:hypothetical protein
MRDGGTSPAWPLVDWRSRLSGIQPHGLDFREKEEGPNRPEANEPYAIANQPADVLLGLRRLEWNGSVGVRDSLADELDVGVAHQAVVPAPKVMTGLDPDGTLRVVEDREAGFVDGAMVIERAEDPLSSSWVERGLHESSQAVECQNEHDEPREGQDSCSGGASHPRKVSSDAGRFSRGAARRSVTDQPTPRLSPAWSTSSLTRWCAIHA